MTIYLKESIARMDDRKSAASDARCEYRCICGNTSIGPRTFDDHQQNCRVLRALLTRDGLRRAN
jgi:hypothetical protein